MKEFVVFMAFLALIFGAGMATFVVDMNIDADLRRTCIEAGGDTQTIRGNVECNLQGVNP